MKTTALLFFIPVSLSAQIRQGTIVYERTIDVHRRIQDEQMKAMAPHFQTSTYELLFKDSVAMYRAVPKDEAPDPFENSGGNRFVMRFGGPGDDGVFYSNFSSGRLLEEASLADKKYIITDTLRTQPWKLSEDTLTILGHICKKATMTTPRGSAVVAWYCGDIPLPVGPDQFSGLPGAVLKADVGEGEVVFLAKQLSTAVADRQLKAPSGGRPITRAEFRKKMDELMGPPDAQGRRIIRN